MRSPDDDDADMADRWAQLGAAADGQDPLAAGSGPTDVALLVREIQVLGRQPAPAPSPELEALLRQGLPNLRKRRRRTAAVGIVVAGSMSMTGIAAAADRLPGPSQGVVTHVINHWTPFHVDDRRQRPTAPNYPARLPERQAPAPAAPRPSDDRDLSGPEPVEQPDVTPTLPRGTEHERDGGRTPAPNPSPTSNRTGDDEREGAPTSSPTRSDPE
jgi:hypothetical protein